MKIFKLNCNTFGWKFSFNAINEEDATSKAKGWCRYHGFCYREEYTIEETTDTNRMHNEYVD